MEFIAAHRQLMYDAAASLQSVKLYGKALEAKMN